MAEISRENYKITLKKWLGCNDCDTDECLSSICVDCKNHYDEDDFRQALEKALSDMEKLEKIEKVIDTTLIAKEPYKVKIETIEQI